MDIDQLSEPELVRLYQSALSDRTGEVNGALNMGNHKGALAASLKKPPLGVSDQALLVRLVLQHHTTPHDTTRHHRWPPAALARSLSIYARYRSSSLSYRYPILYMECSPPASEHLLLLSLACSPQSPSIDSACCVNGRCCCCWIDTDRTPIECRLARVVQRCVCVQDESTQLVVQVISSAKAADAPALIGELSDPQADLLLKYIYRGMASYSFQSGDQANGVLSALLAWHEAIIARTGLGAIVRAMAERKNIL